MHTSPASQRPVREHGEAGKPSPGAEFEQQDRPKRSRSRLGASGSEDVKMDEMPHVPQPPGVTAGASISMDSVVSNEGANAAQRQLRKLEKKLREISKLQGQARTLTPDEQAKVARLDELTLQAELLRRAPATPAAHAPASQSSSAAASAAPTMLQAASSAAGAAAALHAAQMELEALPTLPPTRVGTRANAVAVERQLAASRAALEADLVSKEKGVYADWWREDTYLQRHEDTGQTLSLRGTVGVTRAGLRRLKALPDEQKPAVEHWTTIRLHDYQAHEIQRTKALANTFSVKRCALQWDEVRAPRPCLCILTCNCMSRGCPAWVAACTGAAVA